MNLRKRNNLFQNLKEKEYSSVIKVSNIIINFKFILLIISNKKLLLL